MTPAPRTPSNQYPSSEDLIQEMARGAKPVGAARSTRRSSTPSPAVNSSLPPPALPLQNLVVNHKN